MIDLERDQTNDMFSPAQASWMIELDRHVKKYALDTMSDRIA